MELLETKINFTGNMILKIWGDYEVDGEISGVDLGFSR